MDFNGLNRLVHKPRLVIPLAAASVLAGCVLYAVLNGIPQPAIQDEFSYLLMGDTFASGRLTNPPHPMWRHFETRHVIQQPTYASKYPPGQGLFLAFGQMLGHPILGAWLSTALMVAGISWMLYQWVPPKWAFLGSVIAVVQFGSPNYWAQSYWGGALAALGGVLVYGSLRAATTGPRVSHGVLFGLGAMVLANTRPLEGMVAGLPAAAALVWLTFREKGAARAQWLRRVMVPAAMLMLATLGTVGIYNWKLTGDPMRLPYQAYNEIYDTGREFPWQKPGAAFQYRSMTIDDIKRGGSALLTTLQEKHFLKGLLTKSWRLNEFFLGPLVLALLMLPVIMKDRWFLLAALTSMAVVGTVILTILGLPHYAAPATGLFLILVLEGLRRLNARRSRIVDGRILMVLILLAYLPYLFARRAGMHPSWLAAFAEERHRIFERLEATEGDDLVIVRYHGRRDVVLEWVHNRAAIDSAEIVWAHEMLPEENRKLIRYFEGRRAWFLDVEGSPRMRPHHLRLGPVADADEKSHGAFNGVNAMGMASYGMTEREDGAGDRPERGRGLAGRP